MLIAAAGGAAHLPGVLASWSTLPIIGVPLGTSALQGIDSLYSIVQMPPGMPVATVSVGPWGARNAAYLAAQILALQDEKVRAAYEDTAPSWLRGRPAAMRRGVCRKVEPPCLARSLRGCPPKVTDLASGRNYVSLVTASPSHTNKRPVNIQA